MCLRVAVREVESWLLADREQIARFLSVRLSQIPREPDELEDPKRVLISIAGGSRKREIRQDLVPRPESGRAVGPAYDARLIEFVANCWHPVEAAVNSRSLHRCIAALERLVEIHR